MNERNGTTGRGILLAALLLCVPGFALSASTAGEYVQEARKLLESGEVKTAIIELKNALQRDPGHVEARILLGKTYLRMGNGAAAEKELMRAAKLNVDRKRWQSDLGRAYLLQRKFKQLMEEITIDPADSKELRGELLALRGQAYLAVGKSSDAEQAFNESLQLRPDYPVALAGLSRLALMDGNRQLAMELINRVLEKDPDHISALLIRGELARQNQQLEQAEEDVSRVLELDQHHSQARLLRVAIRLAKGENAMASKDLEIIEKQQPQHPLVLYMRALVAFQAKDFDKADEALQLVLSNNPGHVQSQLLYGAVSYARGEFKTASEYLGRVINALPNHLPATKLLAAARMKLRQPEKAIEVLEPAVEQHPQDPQLLALLGSAYLRHGEHARASEMLSKAVELAPDLAALRTELALGLLAKGDSEEAISELKSAVDLGQGVTQADTLLVLSHLQRKEYEEALKAGRALEKRMPESPIPLNLTGLAYLAQGDKQNARDRFNKALKVDSDFTVASMNLARIELSEGKRDVAEQRYKDIIQRHPNHLGALLGMAAIAEKRRDRSATESWLAKAQDRNPKVIQPGLLLTRFYLAQREALKALRVANELSNRFPAAPAVLQALGEAQLAAGKTHSAIGTFEMLAKEQSSSPAAWFLLGRTQLIGEEVEKARHSLQQALDLAPGFTQARLTLASLELQSGNHEAALKLARELQKNHAELAAGYEVEGAVLVARKQLQAGVSHYRKAYDVQPSARLAAILSRQYSSLGKKDEAMGILKEWLAGHPDDVPILTQLGIALQTAGQNREAISNYEKALTLAPENILLLNNLAWLYEQANDKRALMLAKKAYDLAPERPAVVDTYGWILAKSGAVKPAVSILQQAVVSAPTNPEIAYHLAYVLHKAGRNEEARKILKRNLRDHPDSPVAGEARELLQQL